MTGRSEARIHPFPRPPVRVGSGGKGILLQIPVYQKLSKGKQTFFSLYFCVRSCCIWAYSHLLQLCVLLLCCHCCAFHCIIALHCSSRLLVSLCGQGGFCCSTVLRYNLISSIPLFLLSLRGFSLEDVTQMLICRGKK